MTIIDRKTKTGARRNRTVAEGTNDDPMKERAMRKPIEQAVELATGAALESIESMDRIIALKARVDDLDAVVEVNIKKISDLVADLGSFKEQTTRQLQQLNQSAAAFQSWQNTAQPVLTAVTNQTTGLAATNAQANQTASALAATQNTVTTISAQVTKLEAKVFHLHQQEQQQTSFNLTIPDFDEQYVKVVMIDPTSGNTIMTFKTTPGSTVSVVGTPGQVSKFELLNSQNVGLDSVTLTIPSAQTTSSASSTTSGSATQPSSAAQPGATQVATPAVTAPFTAKP